MSSNLNGRLTRLEGRSSANPWDALTDEQLELSVEYVRLLEAGDTGERLDELGAMIRADPHWLSTLESLAACDFAVNF